MSNTQTKGNAKTKDKAKTQKKKFPSIKVLKTVQSIGELAHSLKQSAHIKDNLALFINIFGNVIEYPSALAARLHMEANTLGENDIFTKQDLNFVMDSYPQYQYQKQIKNKTSNKGPNVVEKLRTQSKPSLLSQADWQKMKASAQKQLKTDKKDEEHKISLFKVLGEGNKVLDIATEGLNQNISEKDKEILCFCLPKNDDKSKITLRRRCQCCGLYEQRHLLDTTQAIDRIKHIGFSIYLYFVMVESLILILIPMLLAFAGYALFTNYQLNKKHGKIPFFSQQILRSASIRHALHEYKKNKNHTPLQLETYLIILSILLIFILFIFVKRRQNKLIQKMDEQTISASDFTLLFENIPISYLDESHKFLEEKKKSLNKKQHFSKRDPVAKLFQTQLQACVKDYRKRQNQFGTKQNWDIKVQKVSFAYFCDPDQFDGQQKTYGNKQLKQMTEKMNKIREKFIDIIKNGTKEDFKHEKKFKPQINQYKMIKQQRLKKYKQVKKQQQKQFFKKIRQKSKTASAFVTFKSNQDKYLIEKMTIAGQNKIKIPLKLADIQGQFDQILDIKRAPEPEDIIWKSFNVSHLKRSRTIIFTTAAIIVILCISFMVVFFGNFFQRKLDNSPQKGTQLNIFLSHLLSFILTVINFVIDWIIPRLVKKEIHITNTQQQASIATRSIITMLGNSILIPVLVYIIIKNKIYGKNGLADLVVGQALTMCILAPILKILNTSYLQLWFNQYTSSLPNQRIEKTQKQLNKIYERLEFEIGEQCVKTVYMYLFACFYAPMQPIIVPITILGLIATYITQKFYLFKYCKRLPPGDETLNNMIYHFVFMGPLFFSIGCLVWACLVPKINNLLPQSLAAVALSIIILINPFKWMKIVYDPVLPELRNYFNNKAFFGTQYDRCNPMTKKSAEIEHCQYLLDYLVNYTTIVNQDEKTGIQARLAAAQNHLTGTEDDTDTESENGNEIDEQWDSEIPYYQIYLDYNKDRIDKHCHQLKHFLDNRQKNKRARIYIQLADLNSQDLLIIKRKNFRFKPVKKKKLKAAQSPQAPPPPAVVRPQPRVPLPPQLQRQSIYQPQQLFRLQSQYNSKLLNQLQLQPLEHQQYPNQPQLFDPRQAQFQPIPRIPQAQPQPQPKPQPQPGMMSMATGPASFNPPPPPPRPPPGPPPPGPPPPLPQDNDNEDEFEYIDKEFQFEFDDYQNPQQVKQIIQGVYNRSNQYDKLIYDQRIVFQTVYQVLQDEQADPNSRDGDFFDSDVDNDEGQDPPPPPQPRPQPQFDPYGASRSFQGVSMSNTFANNVQL